MAADLYNADQGGKSREEYITNLLQKFGLEVCADNKVGNALIKGISGGQKRRLSIAMGIINHPKIMFLDEPTSGLDAMSASVIMDLLTELAHKDKLLIVCVIHQPSSRTFRQLDRVLLLSGGHVIYFGKAVR
eukprot:UN28290